MSWHEHLQALAVDAGLVGVGVCGPEPFPEVEAALVAAKADGRSGSLSFTFTDPSTSSDPTASFPWARSIIVSAHSYLPEAGSPASPGAGEGTIARFATEDHYRPLRRGLETIAAELERLGHRAEVVCDDNRLVDRALAVRSGIAWWGKSTMALAPGVGPWMLIGSVVTDADIEPTQPQARDCGTCDACIPACPTGAIVAPGMLDARRCLAAILQSPGPIPLELRESMGERWYGCDECLTACPPGGRRLAAADADRGRVDLHQVLGTADRPLRERYQHFYVPRNDVRHLRRNAVVALGNNPGPDSELVLAGFLGSPDPLIRGHAAWALGRIGGQRAVAALRFAAASEEDPGVRQEMGAAIGQARRRSVGTLA